MFKKNSLNQNVTKILVLILLTFVASIALSACGNKGDLYLPQKGSVDDSKSKSVKKKS